MPKKIEVKLLRGIGLMDVILCCSDNLDQGFITEMNQEGMKEVLESHIDQGGKIARRVSQVYRRNKVADGDIAGLYSLVCEFQKSQIKKDRKGSQKPKPFDLALAMMIDLNGPVDSWETGDIILVDHVEVVGKYNLAKSWCNYGNTYLSSAHNTGGKCLVKIGELTGFTVKASNSEPGYNSTTKSGGYSDQGTIEITLS